MICADFFLDSQKVVRAFRFQGHAGYADSGSDIVCAGLSAIASTVIGTLQESLRVAPEYRIDEEKGYIACRLQQYERYSDEEQIKASCLMFSAFVGVEQAAVNYGQYIKVNKLEYTGRETI